MYHTFIKRIFDIIFSVTLILILSPILISIFIIVWIKIGSPIFSQKRPGLNNKIFTIYKFKTLYNISESNNESNRQSKFGNFLRKTGLDELPQLINILKNDMSFVGPRPLLVEYLDKYSNFEKKRHLVKPGITGLAQINPGADGNKLWKKSIELDVFYSSNVSFFLDISILYHTCKIILMNKKQYNDFKKFNE